MWGNNPVAERVSVQTFPKLRSFPRLSPPHEEAAPNSDPKGKSKCEYGHHPDRK